MLSDFQNYFTVRIRRKFVITLSLKIPWCDLLCEMPSVLKATNENKTTCVTTHFKKVTTLSQLLSKVTVTSCSFLHQMFNVSALLLDDALKPVTPLTNGAINETLRQFAPLSDDRLLQLVDCCESSTLIDHLLKGTPNSVVDWIQVRAVWGHMSGSMSVTLSCRRYISV